MTDPVSKFPFTEEEYLESDSVMSGNEDDYLAMTDSAFAVTHDHNQQSVMMTQRFTKMIVNGEGFSEKTPQQSTLIIPMDQLKLVMIMLMNNYQCLTENESDEENND